MSNEPIVHPVYRGLNKPLTIMGAERGLFFLAAAVGAATFNFFDSFIGGLLMFAVLFAGARWSTVNDPQALRILLNSTRIKDRYDPAKPEGPC